MRCSETTRVLTYALHRSGPSDPIPNWPSAVRCPALRSCFHVCVGGSASDRIADAHCTVRTAIGSLHIHVAARTLRSRGCGRVMGAALSKENGGSDFALAAPASCRTQCECALATYNDARTRTHAEAVRTLEETESRAAANCERQLLRALHCIGIGFSTTRLVRDLNAKHCRVSRLLQHHLTPQWRVPRDASRSHLRIGQCIGNPT